MARFNIHPWAKVGSLKNATVMDLTAELSNMKIENDLRREVQDNIRRLKDMGTYRGRRHAMGLPVRGQRTRTQVIASPPRANARTLTTIDHHRTKAKQDRARRPGTCPVVAGTGACLVLYRMIIESLGNRAVLRVPYERDNMLYGGRSRTLACVYAAANARRPMVVWLQMPAVAVVCQNIQRTCRYFNVPHGRVGHLGESVTLPRPHQNLPQFYNSTVLNSSVLF
jgi:ribosomal protein S13